MDCSGLYDLIIIGGGPGGLTAGIYAMRAALKTVLVEMGAPGGQVNLSDAVENWPGDEHIGGAELSLKMLNHARSYGMEIRSDEVTVIEPGLDGHTVRLAGGDCLKAHSVILATGGSPRKLEVPGEKEFYGRGVSYCAVCDGFFFRNKAVAVVGGGDSAIEEALYLAKLAREVIVVHRRDQLRAGALLQQRAKAECRIRFAWNSVVTAIQADANGVNAVALRNTVTGDSSALPVDGLFIFIGFVPNNRLVPAGIRRNADGYVITDEKCATTIPGLYVIGDLREKYARQIVLSAADGCTAALAAAHYVETRKAALECALPAAK
ncbi:MAG: thioredoxin-disulfide reductase [Desulfobacterales bacterium]|nr:thioredoxin-disulfide reductase [Desulfobacterales bacterium]MCU0584448.1 thioredoxin-disulfide reductase [Desulfobacterales bacterium]